MNLKNKKLFVKSGYLKGQKIQIVDSVLNMNDGIDDDLGTMYLNGNMAAKSAIELGQYTSDNKPFFYGKIGAFGYIVSAGDLDLSGTLDDV